MEPKHHPRLAKKALSAFRSYMEHGNDEQLIAELSAIKKDGRNGKSIWFRFFKSYTGATTVRNMAHDMDGTPSRNRTYYIECMKMAIETPAEFLCHFS